jgi:tRNA-Thr(GGU) m(6)t(6)A37 methyltransferase TsaA
MTFFSFEPVGFIRSCFTEKFGIPRQPGLAPHATARIEMEAPFCRPEAFRRLETFSHVWILFVFHQSHLHHWKPTVRPPRLGGNQRVGVFASRSGFRPNAIGQSAVKLICVNRAKGQVELLVGGADFLDGTPVLDIKPYLPYCDAVSDANSGYLPDQPTPHRAVVFSSEAATACSRFEHARRPDLKQLITELVTLDPRPGYRQAPRSRAYGMRLWDLNVRFRFEGDHILVESISPIQSPDERLNKEHSLLPLDG